MIQLAAINPSVVVIVPLPCGCLSDMSDLPAITVKENDASSDLIECPWCAATFLGTELATWLCDDSSPIVLRSRPPRQLIVVGDDVFEIVDQCQGCGQPVICARGGKPFHLPGSINALVLRN